MFMQHIFFKSVGFPNALNITYYINAFNILKFKTTPCTSEITALIAILRPELKLCLLI